MKLWIDDLRPAPEDYIWIRSVSDARKIIEIAEGRKENIEIIDLDFDSGDYEYKGGQYIKIMDWLVFRGTLYPLVFHGQNCAEMEQMKRMYRKYWLDEPI